MPKNILLAKSAGFCHGVRRAVETVKKLHFDNPSRKIYVLGDLVHNSLIREELAKFGIKTITEIPDTPNPGAICVIRAHGEAPENIRRIKNLGYEIVDLTCPDVKKVQQRAITLAQEGYYVVIIGKEKHPEVTAIKANVLQYSQNVVVISNSEELLEHKETLRTHKKIGVVVQTTQAISRVKDLMVELLPLAKELKIENTICPSTANRQKEALELAKVSDLVIIVGSRTSANTTHLAQICQPITRAIHIEKDVELENYRLLLQQSENIAVTAGASTPPEQINKVLRKLAKEIK